MILDYFCSLVNKFRPCPSTYSFKCLELEAIVLETRVLIVQCDQKVSLHLMITIQKVTSNVHKPPVSLHNLLTLRTVFSKTVFSITRSTFRMYPVTAIFKSWLCGDCNRHVHRDFLITIYCAILLYCWDLRQNWQFCLLQQAGPELEAWRNISVSGGFRANSWPVSSLLASVCVPQ